MANGVMIEELDVVTLTHDIQEHGLKKGSKGAVVHCYEDRLAFEVEFVSDTGETVALLTLERADIQLERETMREKVLEILDALPEDLMAEVRDFAEFLQQKQISTTYPLPPTFIEDVSQLGRATSPGYGSKANSCSGALSR